MENWSFWAERNVKVAGAQSSCGGCSRVQREGKGQDPWAPGAAPHQARQKSPARWSPQVRVGPLQDL